MKKFDYCRLLLILTLYCYAGCRRTDSQPATPIGTGMEIYLSRHPNAFRPELDYSQIPLDTIQLADQPVIPYGEIRSYSLATHTLRLNSAAERLKQIQTDSYGRMFVITLDRKPIYCGFYMPLFSSLIPRWAYIHEPIGQQDQLLIAFFSPVAAPDPRPDSRLLARLRRDGKLQ